MVASSDAGDAIRQPTNFELESVMNTQKQISSLYHSRHVTASDIQNGIRKGRRLRAQAFKNALSALRGHHSS